MTKTLISRRCALKWGGMAADPQHGTPATPPPASLPGSPPQPSSPETHKMLGWPVAGDVRDKVAGGSGRLGQPVAARKKARYDPTSVIDLTLDESDDESREVRSRKVPSASPSSGTRPSLSPAEVQALPTPTNPKGSGSLSGSASARQITPSTCIIDLTVDDSDEGNTSPGPQVVIDVSDCDD